MVKNIVICVNPKQDELMNNIINWSKENLKLSQETSLTLLFAHCVESDLATYALEPDFASVSEYIIKEGEEHLREFDALMSRLSSQFKKELNVPVEFKILKGIEEPYNQISKFVEENHSELLIVGSRDLGFWQRLWSTSFSDSIIHSVHCPIVIIKPSLKEG
ncbi:adenine nucleotide alpha hydrolases-like protein [Neoconidiobolus thromboides FSU 785]|nr:adenine nucleotide alpha hydrolases-like protein [Neoconidiobolus thromboides FSU 785]